MFYHAQLCGIFRNSNHLDKLVLMQINFFLPCMNEINGQAQ